METHGKLPLFNQMGSSYDIDRLASSSPLHELDCDLGKSLLEGIFDGCNLGCKFFAHALKLHIRSLLLLPSAKQRYVSAETQVDEKPLTQPEKDWPYYGLPVHWLALFSDTLVHTLSAIHRGSGRL